MITKNKLFVITAILVAMLFTGCNKKVEGEENTAVTEETTEETKVKTETVSMDSEKPEATIDEKSEGAEEVTTDNPALQSYLETQKKEWEGIVNPMTVTFKEFVLGDYPHIIFADAEGKEFDFGDGNNAYGEFSPADFQDEESQYLGKKFNITWEWKESEFNCCEGAMDLVKAKVPSIAKIELVK